MNNRIMLEIINNTFNLVIEKFENDTWNKVTSTTSLEIIKDLFKNIYGKIIDIKHDNNTTIYLKDKTILEISNKINIEESDVFKPLIESIHFYNQEKNKKNSKRIRNFKVSIFATAFILANNNPVNLNYAKDFDTLQTNNILNYNDAINNKILLNNINTMQDRLERQIMENNYKEYLPSFGINTYDEKYNNIIEKYDDIVDKYALISGIDKEIIICLLAQERGTHSSKIDDGGAIGIGQIQVNQHLNSTLTLYNNLLGEEETFEVSMDLLKSIEGNIKTSVTILQSALKRFGGNIFLALQAYNYGEGAVNTIIKKTGLSLDEINANYKDISWIEEVYKYSDKKGGYGDKNYIDNVFSRYPCCEITVIYDDDSTIININELIKTKRILN